ncbi:MAG TPA: hypothetical protein PKW95_07475 [bacterium]|nr:hypothetical protein [bacterium]
MRWVTLTVSLLMMVALLGCGAGEKPEYVEVPSGDPMPPAGTGEPIQDAPEDDDAQGCGEMPPLPAQLKSRELLDEEPQGDDPPHPFEWAPLEDGPPPAESKDVPLGAALLAPLFLAIALRRKD